MAPGMLCQRLICTEGCGHHIALNYQLLEGLGPPKVTPPAWSLSKFLRIDPSSRRARKRWRSHRLITPRPSKPLGLGRRSLTELSDELILLVVNHLQDVSPESVADLALVSSFFYGKARYVQHREESIDLRRTEEEVLYLNYLATTALLPAIRTISFDSFDWRHPEASGQFPVHLNELVNQMTGLRDIYWGFHDRIHAFCPPPSSLIQNLKRHSRVRLHTSVVEGGDRGNITRPNALQRIQEISCLVGSPNLYSLRAEIEHTEASAIQETQPIMRRLKELLLSCPNLRNLSLDIHTPRSGCLHHGLTNRYCGLGLSNGEKLPPLEELEIVDYPWGRYPRTVSSMGYGTIGYPEKGTEEDYWAEHCDWSRLRRLTLPNSWLAKKITQKLTALEQVSFRHRIRFQNMAGSRDERDTVQFLQDLPTALESLSIPNLPTLGTDPIIRHGPRLRRLELLRSDHPYKIKNEWKEIAVTCEDLVRLRDGLPKLEELALDIAKEGNEWPYKALEILASFPRLRNLKLTFGLSTPEKEDTPAPPYLTMASAEALFRYIREHSSSQYPPLQRLHVCSLGGQGLWANHNSTSFVVCKLPGHGDVPEQVTVSCTKLREELNEKMRRIVRGEATPTLEEMGWINFKVALDGPMSKAPWDLMRATDSVPHSFARTESYTYLVDSFSC
ncbi:hypothetical protein CONLIGDRAFT_675634 [Coniochaeta ligniaria NRRL 30616]|uniref:F-box domain-containing protein n=1 Tax=Coniochaeta ligniaria NRRL 30616 TaxID=1408157 RepID=A0A1J7JZ25_9PEZI|nr:hypothetical protein CONLIGDRAFT_675634 [Coniochaeta ligniaria NRRL 30616]